MSLLPKKMSAAVKAAHVLKDKADVPYKKGASKTFAAVWEVQKNQKKKKGK